MSPAGAWPSSRYQGHTHEGDIWEPWNLNSSGTKQIDEGARLSWEQKVRGIRTEVGGEQGRETTWDWPSEKPLKREDIWLKLGTETHRCKSRKVGADLGMAVAQWARREWQSLFFSILVTDKLGHQTGELVYNVILNSLSLIPKFAWAQVNLSGILLHFVFLTRIQNSLFCLALLSSHFNPVFKKLPEWSLEDKVQLQLKSPQWLPVAIGWSPTFSLEAYIIWPPVYFLSLSLHSASGLYCERALPLRLKYYSSSEMRTESIICH